MKPRRNRAISQVTSRSFVPDLIEIPGSKSKVFEVRPGAFPPEILYRLSEVPPSRIFREGSW